MDVDEFDGKDLEDALGVGGGGLGPARFRSSTTRSLEGGRKGVFGLGARPVRIRVAGRVAATPPTAAPAAPAAATVSARGGAGSASGLADIVDKMGFELRVEESRQDGTLRADAGWPDRSRSDRA